MDLTRIELNRPYKPREICDLLNRPFPDSTYQRRKLYEDLSSLFVWHKEGYSIVVDEIISTIPITPQKVKIEKNIPFTTCIDHIMSILPIEFTDEELFTLIFNISFDELTDVSSYTGFSADLIYDFTWCLRNKSYSKYHTALAQINKRQRLDIKLLNAITGELFYNSLYCNKWENIVRDGYSYSKYTKALTELNGNIPIYRYKDTAGGYVSQEVYLNIYKHLYDYIYRSFVPKASNKTVAAKLVKLWSKDKFKMTFEAPKIKAETEAKKTSLKFTDCMRYRIDKYMRENNKESMTYNDICLALYNQSLNDIKYFDYDYKAPTHRSFNNEDTGEWTEYEKTGNLLSNFQGRISHAAFSLISHNLASFKKTDETRIQLFVEDKGIKRLANFTEAETILIRERRVTCEKHSLNMLKELREDLCSLGVKYLPKEFVFSFKRVKDFSSRESEVQKTLNEYLLRRVRYEIVNSLKLKKTTHKADEMLSVWYSQKLETLVGKFGDNTD